MNHVEQLPDDSVAAEEYLIPDGEIEPLFGCRSG
jgi:hypothetical protein